MSTKGGLALAPVIVANEMGGRSAEEADILQEDRQREDWPWEAGTWKTHLFRRRIQRRMAERSSALFPEARSVSKNSWQNFFSFKESLFTPPLFQNEFAH